MKINRPVRRRATCGPQVIGHGTVLRTTGCRESGYPHRAWACSGHPAIGGTPVRYLYFIAAIGAGGWATTAASTMASGTAASATSAAVGWVTTLSTTMP